MLRFLLLITIFIGSLMAKENYKVLVPLYSHPTSWKSFDKQFRELQQNNVPTYLIINPHNGPGTKIDPIYIAGIKYLKSFDFNIIGYVHTSYSKRNQFEVKLDIYNWSDFYGSYGIDGIFFDETDTQEKSFYIYKDLIDYAKQQDFNFNILNAGYTTNKKYIDNKIANVVITYENSHEGFLKEFPKTTNKSNDFTKLSILLHTVKGKKFKNILSKLDNLDFQYIYLTEDSFPNPWDDLSKDFIDSLIQ